MKFLRQIKFEIRNIIKSKFLLIIGILVVAISIAIPVIGKLTMPKEGQGPGGYPMPMGAVYYSEKAYYGYGGYDGGGKQEPITVDGVTLTIENPFYWNINSLMQEKTQMGVDKNRFSSPEALDLALELVEGDIHYYAHFAKFITKQTDYRMDLAWRGSEYLYDKFIYEHNDANPDYLMEAVNTRKGMDPTGFKKKYFEITSDQRQAALIKADENLASLFSVVENNDFPKYVDLSIKQFNDQITSLKDNIAIQEKAIIDNPSQEESIKQIIDDLNKQIKMIEENNIPLLKYRLEKNILPGEPTWQNSALSDIEGSRNQLMYTTLLDEKKFNENQDLVRQYGNYRKYSTAVQAQINQMNNNILIAQRSLDAGKPDMKYEASGARSRTVSFLDYSVIIAIFAVLIGGWIMASEFQQGTIRLLMIRPKTRTKILISKFLAAFAVCIALYIGSSILNMVATGICFGFADFAFPNYTISGEVGFFIYYLPIFFECIATILFAFTAAFMLSVLTKNIAVSIAIPIVCFVGCTILTSMVAFRQGFSWIAYTPIPYVQISSFFTPYSTVQAMIQNGMPLNLTYGIIMLLALSAICTFVSILVFKKRDIAN